MTAEPTPINPFADNAPIDPQAPDFPDAILQPTKDDPFGDASERRAEMDEVLDGELVGDDEEYTGDLGTSTVVKESVTVTDDTGKTTTAKKKVTVPGPDEMPSIEKDWPHEKLECLGYTFGVRVPSQQALTGFTMSTGEYVPEMMRQNMVSLFMHKHFSPQSFLFVMTRLMNPDDTDFDENSFNTIIEALIKLSSEKIIADLEAKRAAAEKAKAPARRLKPRKPRA
jgi:hypothetical protein